MKLKNVLFALSVIVIAVLGAFATSAKNAIAPTLVYYYDNPSSPDRLCKSVVLEILPCEFNKPVVCQKIIIPEGSVLRPVFANIDEETGECVDPYTRLQ